MSRIAVEKLRRIIEALLTWRNARPVKTRDGEAQTEFSRGYETFAKDLHRELDSLEKHTEKFSTQRNWWNRKK